MAMANWSSNKNIDQLNSFLRGEMAAVETYRIALDKLPVDSPARSRLDAAMQSHAERVATLRTKILALGGKPSESAGAWGAMTRAIETSATALGDKAAISVLEEGEDHGLKDYQQDVVKLGGDAREIVVTQLLPQQEQTHRMVSDLKHELQRS